MSSFPDRPFTLADVAEMGLPRSRLTRAVATGEVRRLLRGVYVSSSVPDSPDLRIGAIALAVAPGHVACDRTAGWVHGVDLLGLQDPGVAPPLEVCVLRGNEPTTVPGTRGRTRDLLAADVEEVGGVLVTTPLRTALDLGCILRRRDALAALDQFRRLHGLTVEDLQRSVVRYFRRRGVVQLRSLIPLSDPASESVRESWTRLAIIDAGLPSPVLQHEIEEDGVVLFRLDHAYPSSRVAVEYDGQDFHRTEEQVDHDRRRRGWLRDRGWRVIVVRRGDFRDDRLQGWLRELREALEASYSNLRW